MTAREYPRLGETLYRQTLSNGLTVLVVPRPGFTRKLAYFVSDFGSIHTDFELEGRAIHAPAGIAHFLEHKMFDLPDGRDVSAELAALGAGTNAFTSYDMTAYYITCTENFEPALKLLLEFVSTPYFTQESVQKEIGIIDQEIGMHLDNPDSRVFELLSEGLYKEHPIRLPILGSSESIRQITPELLYDCHRAFYTPGNMILCVVGDVEPDRVAEIATEILGSSPRPVGRKLRGWNESMERTTAQQTENMEVAMPMFNLGFKCEHPGSGEAAIRQEMVGDLAAEALFGESSELYLRLYEAGLIDSSFGGGFETIDGMAMLLCSGDSDDADAIREAVLKQAQKIACEGVTEEAFTRMKRSAFGRRVRDLDSFDSTCFRLCAYALSDYDYFNFPDVYERIEKQEIQEFLCRVVRPERCSLSVINPLEEEA
ncbi:MAG: insulinase family protein [Oscillospiraceae bacterium]|nr:insulinase family protein [Oscillospiraceae bacterium]